MQVRLHVLRQAKYLVQVMQFQEHGSFQEGAKRIAASQFDTRARLRFRSGKSKSWAINRRKTVVRVRFNRG
jgi:hypothetical protein